VQSHAYAETCRREGLRALEKACPLLVPLVEEGWIDHPVTAEVFRVYLDELNAEAAARGLNPDTLVLGCTHYPLLKPLIERSVPAGMRVIDSAEAATDNLIYYLSHDVAAPPPDGDPLMKFFATDSVEKFERLGSRFLGRPVRNVQLVDLGG
jgi:glutamate racemase